MMKGWANGSYQHEAGPGLRVTSFEPVVSFHCPDRATTASVGQTDSQAALTVIAAAT
jgi:hypothetical protein